MADIIKIKTRNEVTHPSPQRLATNELGYNPTEEALYIGTAAKGNIKLCVASDITKLNGYETRIAALESQIASLSARLDALENTGEQE